MPFKFGCDEEAGISLLVLLTSLEYVGAFVPMIRAKELLRIIHNLYP